MDFRVRNSCGGLDRRSDDVVTFTGGTGIVVTDRGNVDHQGHAAPLRARTSWISGSRLRDCRGIVAERGVRSVAAPTTKTLTNRLEVEQFLKDNSSRLRQYDLARIGLFGSYLHGSQTHASDIDLLVEFVPGEKTFDNFMGLAYFLEDHSRRRVELVTPESLSEDVEAGIRKEVEFVELAA